VSVSVCVCHKSVFYRNADERIGLVFFGKRTSFDLSYTVL